MFWFKFSKYNIPLTESSIWYLKSSPTKIFVFFFSNNPSNSKRKEKLSNTDDKLYNISTFVALIFKVWN